MSDHEIVGKIYDPNPVIPKASGPDLDWDVKILRHNLQVSLRAIDGLRQRIADLEAEIAGLREKYEHEKN